MKQTASPRAPTEPVGGHDAAEELRRTRAALAQRTDELARARELLRRSEQELADFLDHASIGLRWVGPDGTILRANRAELEMLGYERNEYVGHHIAAFHVDRDAIANALRRLAAGETLREYEARMWCKDGSIKHVLVEWSVRWENGRFLHTRCVTRDITDRKSVAATQARLAAIVESSEDAIIGKTLDGRIESWNAGATRLFGYTAQEAIGRHISIVIPIDRRDEEQLLIQRLRDGERLQHYDTVRVARDGRRIDVSLTVSPVHDTEGRVVGASSIARDVTAKKRAEVALRQSEQTARFLARASATLAQLTDYESTLQRLADLAVPAFADWCLVDMVTADGGVRRLAVTYADPAMSMLAQAIAQRPPVRSSDARGLMNVLRTGEAEWLGAVGDAQLAATALDVEHLDLLRAVGITSWIGVPLRSRGRVIGALSFVTTTSGRVYDATALAAAEDLAHRAVIAIENATLLATLRESDQRKDEFLAMLAHELRNPLAPIRSAAQIVRAKALPAPELQWAVGLIERQVQQMARLVDDLLDVSRISRGRIALRMERIDLATVLNSAVDTTRPLVEKSGHQLTVAMPPDPIWLQADVTRLAQVFSNLLHNAAKYTDHGGQIRVVVERNDTSVLVRVIDTGIGIPRDLLPHVFDLFMQVPHVAQRSEGGLGIGLTLVQRLVDMHRGTVEAHSEGPGTGSEFRVRLPVVAEPALTTPTQAAGDVPPLATRRILLVDDNRDAADSLAMLLRMMGHDVHTAHDGMAALSAVTTFGPEVVLLDIGLPVLNGYEVARRIREQPGGSDIELIAVTGWGQEEDRRRSREAGFDYHITKPVELGELQKLLAAPPARLGSL